MIKPVSHSILSYAALLAIISPLPSYAQDIRDKQKKLQTVQQEIESARSRTKKLQSSMEEAEATLDQLQAETTELAAKLQKHERLLLQAENKLGVLKEKEKEKQEALKKNQHFTGESLAAAIRLTQVPPQAVLLMQGGPEKQVKTARALGMTTASLKSNMDGLTTELNEIAALQDEIAQQKTVYAEMLDELQGQRTKLADRIKKRRILLASLREEQLEEQKRIAQLTKESESLESLVDALEKARKQAKDERFAAIGKPILKPAAPKRSQKTEERLAKQTVSKDNAISISNAKGSLGLPSAGRITGKFGQRRGKNDTLRGLEMETASAATVTAPYAGEVLFTGPFMNYGNMVIIRHSGDYHTLLAGLSRIDVSPGQALVDGEPIGIMGKQETERQLYVELRKNSKPIDPLPWFSSTQRLASR
jgi:septal ring factor EnvC (AmiA/AmiB activator)